MADSLSISGATSALTGASGGTSVGGQQAVGKDQFLQMLVAQIKHQDPLKPMDDTAFVSQLAQFSALEQQLGTNQLLQLVATQNQGLANQSMIALTGKHVTARGTTVSLADGDFTTPIRCNLGGQASEVDVTIRDANGRTVRTIKAGAHASGPITVQWDGRDDGGNRQPAGAYTVSVNAVDAAGKTLMVDQEMAGLVVSVSYENGYAKLVLDNGASVPASDLLTVTQ